MAHVIRQRCDEGVIGSKKADSPCAPNAAPWILAATILGFSMAFIDETAVTVALPAIRSALGATAVDAQWVVAAYTLFLASLVLVGGSVGDDLGRRRVFSAGVVAREHGGGTLREQRRSTPNLRRRVGQAAGECEPAARARRANPLPVRAGSNPHPRQR
jgi:hypothetical protein